MTNLGFLATSREKKKYSDRHNHPRNACKYVKREWDEFESRWYFVNVCNESSKKEFQSEPGWREFAPQAMICLLYTSPSPRDGLLSRMPSSA